MNNVENKVLKGELKYKDTVVLTYNIEYPEIVYSDYILGKQSFNKFNKDIALSLEKYVVSTLFKDASELYDYNVSNNYPIMVYEVLLQYNITYNNNNILSLYYDNYEFTGGAHGNTIRSSQTWDLYLNRQLRLSSFYNNPYYIIDILKNVNNQIAEQISLGNNTFFDNYCQLVTETFNLSNYYLTTNGIVIFFQQYDIAPYSSGIQTFYL